MGRVGYLALGNFAFRKKKLSNELKSNLIGRNILYYIQHESKVEEKCTRMGKGCKGSIYAALYGDDSNLVVLSKWAWKNKSESEEGVRSQSGYTSGACAIDGIRAHLRSHLGRMGGMGEIDLGVHLGGILRCCMFTRRSYQ